MVAAARPPIVRTATVDSAGRAEIQFTSPFSFAIKVSQIGITCLTATGAQGGGQGQAYRNSAPISPFFPPDTLAGEPAEVVNAGDLIRLTLTNAVVAAVLTAAFKWDPA